MWGARIVFVEKIAPRMSAVFSWDVISGSILTFSGRRFSPLDPRLEDIRIEDIAHSWAHLCRFGGHTRDFYSIAQHSWLVSRVCDPGVALWGLLHDASEAYLGDIVGPLKQLPEFERYRLAEQPLQRLITARFGLGPDQPDSVTEADDLMLLIEYRDLMPSSDPPYVSAPPLDAAIMIGELWTPRSAEQRFVERFRQLCPARFW